MNSNFLIESHYVLSIYRHKLYVHRVFQENKFFSEQKLQPSAMQDVQHYVCLSVLAFYCFFCKINVFVRVLQGGPKKVSLIIFAITLSAASQFA